jgi:hypothetical protein
MKPQEAPKPVWRRLYALVIAVLALDILLLWVLGKAFQ